jgi:DNA-directed RNA polymerase specialized sigma24 family protein
LEDKPDLLSPRFEAALAWLDTDQDRAAETRVLFHGHLTRYFLRNHCADPEELADQTFDRVGKLLLEGKNVPAQNHEAYLNRVAFYVLQEYRRKNRLVNQLPDDRPEPPDPRPSLDKTDEGMEKERLHLCLDECLDRLPPESRIMLLEYYSENKPLKIDTRDRMAKRLGIASGVLRNRIWKLRNNLRECIAERLSSVEFAAGQEESK